MNLDFNEYARLLNADIESGLVSASCRLVVKGKIFKGDSRWMRVSIPLARIFLWEYTRWWSYFSSENSSEGILASLSNAISVFLVITGNTRSSIDSPSEVATDLSSFSAKI